jgi:glutamate dehydrogenase (NADP+)
MDKAAEVVVERFMRGLIRRNPGEPEFHQAVRGVAESTTPFILEHPVYNRAQIAERMTEPDRIIIFRVTWEDDRGNIRANRAWRVQFNNSIGPYKGGLRFHPEANLSVLKFLAFEQVFKNSLTGLPLGGAKGGANFNPKGKSESEVMRFCHSLMVEMYRHIGDDVDVPAGDVGVGPREISYMFGQYKRLANRFTGILTGKGLSHGGSQVHTESSGYGVVYFVQKMLERAGQGLAGKTCTVSGAGNVALYAIEKLVQLGARPVTASDSLGFLHDPDGIDAEKFHWLKHHREQVRGPLAAYVEQFPRASYHEGKRPWGVETDVALPCATHNEIDEDDARALIGNGVLAIAEGSNMSCTPGAVRRLLKERIPYAPGKAANAGGVAASGLEQSQNALRMSWSREEVDSRLRKIMRRIHAQCVEHGRRDDGSVDYVAGANIAGFVKVADAMVAYGAV